MNKTILLALVGAALAQKHAVKPNWELEAAYGQYMYPNMQYNASTNYLSQLGSTFGNKVGFFDFIISNKSNDLGLIYNVNQPVVFSSIVAKSRAILINYDKSINKSFDFNVAAGLLRSKTNFYVEDYDSKSGDINSFKNNKLAVRVGLSAKYDISSKDSVKLKAFYQHVNKINNFETINIPTSYKVSYDLSAMAFALAVAHKL